MHKRRESLWISNTIATRKVCFTDLICSFRSLREKKTIVPGHIWCSTYILWCVLQLCCDNIIPFATENFVSSLLENWALIMFLICLMLFLLRYFFFIGVINSPSVMRMFMCTYRVFTQCAWIFSFYLIISYVETEISNDILRRFEFQLFVGHGHVLVCLCAYVSV